MKLYTINKGYMTLKRDLYRILGDMTGLGLIKGLITCLTLGNIGRFLFRGRGGLIRTYLSNIIGKVFRWGLTIKACL